MLEQTRYAQPALFVTSFALAKQWMHWGVQPTCLVGHSVGELVAACVAGVFSVEDALVFVARRGEWMQELPAGSMLAVRMQSQQLQNILPEGVSIAAVNSPSLTVASGPTDAIDLLVRRLEQEHVACRRLRTSHAFHSSMVDPIVDRLRELIGSMQLSEPKLKIISTVTGDALTAAEATSSEYWARHSRVAVNFSAAANTLVREGYEILLEAGAGDTLVTLMRQHLPRGSKAISGFCSLPGDSPCSAASQKSSANIWTSTLGALWSRGVPVDWDSYYATERRRRVSLPTYPFERKRHWVEAKREAPALDPQSKLIGVETPEPEIVENLPPPDGSSIDVNLSALEKDMTSTANAAIDNATPGSEDRSARICQEIAGLLEDLSGLELAAHRVRSELSRVGIRFSLFDPGGPKDTEQVPGQDRFPTIARQPRLNSAGGGISRRPDAPGFDGDGTVQAGPSSPGQ